MAKITGVSLKDAALQNPTVMAKLDANTSKGLQSNPSAFRNVIRILAFAFCVVGGIGAGSTVNLFDTSQAKKTGISDFEQGMKVSNDSIITGIRLTYAQAPTVANGGTLNVADKPYTNLLFSRTNLVAGGVDMDAGATGVQNAAVPARVLPAELANCKLRLSVDGSERFSCDIADFFIENDRKDYQNGDIDDFVSLVEQLILVPAGSSVTVAITGAEGTPVSGTVNHFFKWSILASQIEKIA